MNVELALVGLLLASLALLGGSLYWLRWAWRAWSAPEAQTGSSRGEPLCAVPARSETVLQHVQQMPA